MKTFRLIITSWVIIIFTSCSNPSKEFNTATTINTLDAYENFIKNYPNDSLVIDAKFQICKLKRSIIEYEIFINEYPNSKYIEQSNDNMKKLLGIIKGRFILDTLGTTRRNDVWFKGQINKLRQFHLESPNVLQQAPSPLAPTCC